MQSKALIEAILAGRSSLRTDCPFCGGVNTFSITRAEGKLRWYCFRNSCSNRGSTDVPLTKEDVVTTSVKRSEQKEEKFDKPDFFLPPMSTKQTLEFMSKWRLLQSYADNLFDAAYDPKQNRAVFISRDGYVCTGRSLDYNCAVRWYKYSTASKRPFIVGKNKLVAVITEDVISAIRAAQCHYTGIALLGTNITDDYLPFLKSYNRLNIALDPDATEKAFKLQRSLSGIASASVRLLPRDLKFYPIEEVNGLFG